MAAAPSRTAPAETDVGILSRVQADPRCTEVLLANAATTERQNRLAPESIEALRRDGALALRTPTVHGGLWASPSGLAHRLADLGRACPSAAWIAGTCATSKTIHAGVFGDTPADGAFADPDALACGSGAPSGQGVRHAGGVRISGRWPSVSGCEDAAWANLGLMVDGVFSWAFIPLTELSIDHTWQMAGMCGTGSHTLVADDVRVPAAWVRPGALPSPGERVAHAGPVLAPVLGAAYGALEVTEAMFASGRRPFTTTYSRMADSGGARQWLAEVTHLLSRAEQTMYAVAATAEREDLTNREVAVALMAVADAARDCRSAVERMLDLNGASGFATTNRLQRLWRDVSVGSRHPLLNPYLAVERLGSALTP